MGKERVLIIGAGLTGLMAFCSLRNQYDVQIFDKRSEESQPEHQAIMRLRNPEVGRILGINLKEIIVEKEVLSSDGRLKKQASITDNNQYSKKLYNQIGYRSIGNLGTEKRWLLPSNYLNDFNDIIHWDSEFKGFDQWLRSNIRYKDNSFFTAEPTDIIVSTVSMPFLLSNLPDFDLKDREYNFPFQPITVTKFKLKEIISEVYQTVYVPDPQYNTYRMSMQANEITMESIDEITQGERDKLLKFFGIHPSEAEFQSRHIQKLGKIGLIDDVIRKTIILHLTEKYNIFSLGRYAIWKPIRSDAVIKDIAQIQKMLAIGKEKRKYECKIN